MSREELIKSLTLLKEQARNSGANTFVWDVKIDSFNFVIDSAIKALEQEPRWIPLTKRPMTDEEAEQYFEYMSMRIDDAYTILDCPLPEDGQEVLVSYGGYACVDTFCNDDGCYFEGVDIDDVQAWMPLPEPYKVEG